VKTGESVEELLEELSTEEEVELSGL